MFPGKLPMAVFNSNIENWIEYYFFHKALIQKEKKSIAAIWLVLPTSKTLPPNIVSRFQVCELSHSKYPTGCKTPFRDEMYNTVHLYCAHRLLNTFTYIFSLDSQRLGSSKGHYYYLHFACKKIDSLKPCSLATSKLILMKHYASWENVCILTRAS